MISEAVGITYAELRAAMTGSTLVAGQSYLITDFATIYDRPDYEDVLGTIQPKATIITVTAATEALVVYAIAVNAISPVAYSPSQPQDELWYDPYYDATIINASPAKGMIIKRTDTEKNITMMFDWRSVMFKFYDHGDGRGYVWYYDDGSDDSRLLAPLRTVAASANLTVGTTSLISSLITPFDLPNFTIGSAQASAYDAMLNSSMGSSSQSVVATVTVSVIGLAFNNNRINVLSNSLLGNQCSGNLISLISSCTIGNSFRGVTGSTMLLQDLSAATIIYQFGAKTIMSYTDDVTWITYPNTSGVLQTVAITT
jgi:hypothetical protein